MTDRDEWLYAHWQSDLAVAWARDQTHLETPLACLLSHCPLRTDDAIVRAHWFQWMLPRWWRDAERDDPHARALEPVLARDTNRLVLDTTLLLRLRPSALFERVLLWIDAHTEYYHDILRRYRFIMLFTGTLFEPDELDWTDLDAWLRGVNWHREIVRGVWPTLLVPDISLWRARLVRTVHGLDSPYAEHKLFDCMQYWMRASDKQWRDAWYHIARTWLVRPVVGEYLRLVLGTNNRRRVNNVWVTLIHGHVVPLPPDHLRQTLWTLMPRATHAEDDSLALLDALTKAQRENIMIDWAPWLHAHATVYSYSWDHPVRRAVFRRFLEDYDNATQHALSNVVQGQAIAQLLAQPTASTADIYLLMRCTRSDQLDRVFARFLAWPVPVCDTPDEQARLIRCLFATAIVHPNHALPPWIAVLEHWHAHMHIQHVALIAIHATARNSLALVLDYLLRWFPWHITRMNATALDAALDESNEPWVFDVRRTHPWPCRLGVPMRVAPDAVPDAIPDEPCELLCDRTIAVRFHCGHAICAECILAWCARTSPPTCPFCRAPIDWTNLRWIDTAVPTHTPPANDAPFTLQIACRENRSALSELTVSDDPP